MQYCWSKSPGSIVPADGIACYPSHQREFFIPKEWKRPHGPFLLQPAPEHGGSTHIRSGSLPGSPGGLCHELELEGVTSQASALLRLGSQCTSEAKQTAEEPSGVSTSHATRRLWSVLRKYTFPWVGRPGGVVFHLCTGSLR